MSEALPREMTPEAAERAAVMRREHPAAWVLWMLAEEFPARDLKRDVRTMELVDEVLRDCRARPPEARPHA